MPIKHDKTLNIALGVENTTWQPSEIDGYEQATIDDPNEKEGEK